MRNILPFPRNPDALPQAARLSIQRDDYSVKVVAEGDPRFWVRIEADFGEVRVTDFNPGALPQAELARGLELGLKQAAPKGFAELVFTDIARVDEDPLKLGLKLQKAGEQVKLACEAVAPAFGLKLIGYALDQRRGKFNAVITFARD